MSNIVKLLTLALVLVTTVCGQAGKGRPDRGSKTPVENPRATVTYIANEGVLISCGGKDVLIDGLHRFYNQAYAFPPDDLRDKMEKARAPYDSIDILLVSHLHGDHFHPESIGQRLLNDPNTVLLSSEQVIDQVTENFAEAEKIRTRAKTVKYEWQRSVDEEVNGIKVRFLGLMHGSESFKWIENFGHLIQISGMKFLHIGDADMTDENFAAFNLHEEGIDVAFIPYWFLLEKEGRALVTKQFKPKHIVAVHVSPAEAKEVSAQLRTYYEDITVFTDILETKNF